MMYKGLALLLGLVAVGGCASQIMERYVGKSITEPILDYGPPANVINLQGDRRAFQWQIASSGVVPMTTPSTSTIYGSGGYASVTTQSTSYIPYSSECLYTLTATRSGDDFIVDGFRKPRLGCE